MNAVKAKLGAAVYDDTIDQQRRDEIGAFFEKIMLEDKVQLERLYQGLASRTYQPSVLASADHEGTVPGFLPVHGQGIQFEKRKCPADLNIVIMAPSII